MFGKLKNLLGQILYFGYIFIYVKLKYILGIWLHCIVTFYLCRFFQTFVRFSFRFRRSRGKTISLAGPRQAKPLRVISSRFKCLSTFWDPFDVFCKLQIYKIDRLYFTVIFGSVKLYDLSTLMWLAEWIKPSVNYYLKFIVVKEYL